MTDTEHDERTCTEALHHLQTYLDGELDDAAQHHVRDHLEECMPCFEAFDFEAELRIVVRAKCREEMPDSLRDRIQAELDEAALADGDAG